MSTATSGTLDVTRHYDPETDPACEAPWITIDHADPRITISHKLMEMIDRGECEPYARLDRACGTDCRPGYQRPCYLGSKLEITASNRRLVYVIGEPDFSAWAWSAEWPD